jgi:hypothetical protein
MGIPFPTRACLARPWKDLWRERATSLFSVYRAARKGDDSTNDEIREDVVTTLQALNSRAALLWWPPRLSPQERELDSSDSIRRHK